MKEKIHLITLLLFLSMSHPAAFAQFNSQNITLLSNWYDTTVVSEEIYGIKYSSCFGWVSNGHEYAIIGSSDGTHFIEVTNPSNPVRRAYVPGRRDSCIWREYKTFNKYLYAVSDDASPNSLQIIDMSYLPDSVHKVYDDDVLLERSHTIFIDGDKLYCGSVKGGSIGYSGMAVLSLADPEQPVLLRTIEDDYAGLFGYAHDMFVRNDTVYASCAYDGLFVLNFSGNTFHLLGSLTTYPDQGYNHSSYLSPDGKTLIFCDEVPTNLQAKVADVSDLSDIKVKSLFHSNDVNTPHNPYILGNKAVIAYYQDGIQIFDISNTSNPILTGYFDTNPDNGAGLPNPSYSGCWGAYTELPSGIILASDMQRGLFVLNANNALASIDNPEESISNLLTYPNPFNKNFELNFSLKKNERIHLQLMDLLGNEIFSSDEKLDVGIHNQKISLSSDINAGVYLLKLKGEKTNWVTKVIKVN